MKHWLLDNQTSFHTPVIVCVLAVGIIFAHGFLIASFNVWHLIC